MMKRIFFLVLLAVPLMFVAREAYAQPVEGLRRVEVERNIQEEIVIRIPVRDGRFDFKHARVEGGEPVKAPYEARVNEMVSIPLQIGTGSWHCVYIHFPDCRYFRVWVP